MLERPALLTSGEVDPYYQPKNERELVQLLYDPRWRLYSGFLYKIMVKGDDDEADEPSFVIPFQPNGPQRELLENLHNRNVILKARQLGFTTAIDLFLTDHALFNKDQRCGIIAHSKFDVQTIFRDKVQFAYENLPSLVRDMMPLKSQTKTEYHFAHNNSSIRVAMSMRSGTIHALHISEMGKLAAKFPSKAEEVVTGSLPAVPKNGIALIESTAEGQAGEFYNIATRAEKLAKVKKPVELTPAEWRFFFFPWWKEPNYAMDPRHVIITEKDHQYFDQIEIEMDTLLSNRQRAWYVSKRDEEFSGDEAKMWREYPSKPVECWQQSTEGKYYPKELTAARISNRIRKLHYVPGIPVHTFWDIGSGDGTGIWLMQIVDGMYRFLRYIEGWTESYAHYVKELQDTPYAWGFHFLPHDANHTRQGQFTVAKPLEMLRELAPSWHFEIVPVVQSVQHRIDLVRKHFARAEFDEEGCAAGLIHLANYQKSWSTTAGAWTDVPLKNDATEAADSFGQWAQALEGGMLGSVGQSRTSRSRHGAMAS